MLYLLFMERRFTLLRSVTFFYEVTCLLEPEREREVWKTLWFRYGVEAFFLGGGRLADARNPRSACLLFFFHFYFALSTRFRIFPYFSIRETKVPRLWLSG